MFGSTLARNAQVDAIVGLLSQGLANPTARIVLLDTGIVICTMDMSATPFPAASEAVTTANVIGDGIASAGTADAFEVQDRDGGRVWGGSVSDLNGSGDVKLERVVFVGGEKVKLTEFKYGYLPTTQTRTVEGGLVSEIADISGTLTLTSAGGGSVGNPGTWSDAANDPANYAMGWGTGEYDPSRQRVVFFGGHSGSPSGNNMVRAYVPATNSWQVLWANEQPIDFAVAHPVGLEQRDNQMAWINAPRDELWVFKGQGTETLGRFKFADNTWDKFGTHNVESYTENWDAFCAGLIKQTSTSAPYHESGSQAYSITYDIGVVYGGSAGALQSFMMIRPNPNYPTDPEPYEFIGKDHSSTHPRKRQCINQAVAVGDYFYFYGGEVYIGGVYVDYDIIWSLYIPDLLLTTPVYTWNLNVAQNPITTNKVAGGYASLSYDSDKNSLLMQKQRQKVNRYNFSDGSWEDLTPAGATIGQDNPAGRYVPAHTGWAGGLAIRHTSNPPGVFLPPSNELVLAVGQPISNGKFAKREYAWDGRKGATGKSPGAGIKHLRIAYNPEDEWHYILGGDYAIDAGAVAPNTPAAGASARQELWRVKHGSLSDTWEIVLPYCPTTTPITIARPDTHGWVFDTTRKRIWFIPGFQFGYDDGMGGQYEDGSATGSSYGLHWVSERIGGVDQLSNAPGGSGTRALFGGIGWFDMDPVSPTYKQFRWDDIFSIFNMGGEGNLGGAYDPTTDTLIVPENGSTVRVFDPDLQGPRGPFVQEGGQAAWSKTEFAGSKSLGKDQHEIDVTNRIVFITPKNSGELWIYHIDNKTLTLETTVPLVSATKWNPRSVFDPVNNGLLFWGANHDPNNTPKVTERFFGFYSMTTKNWTTLPYPDEIWTDTSDERWVGNNMWYDPLTGGIALYGSEMNTFEYYYIYKVDPAAIT